MKKAKTISCVMMVLVIMMMVWPAALFAQTDEPACASDVVVQLDDWLSKIAEKEYGDWVGSSSDEFLIPPFYSMYHLLNFLR